MSSNIRRFNNINSTISDNLRKIRGNHTQEEFADILNNTLKRYNIDANYDSKTISNWESLKSRPKLNVLIVIAKESNLSLDELLKEDINQIDRDIEQVNKKNKTNDKDILAELKKDKDVCRSKNDKILSAWNGFDYKYGKLSYVVDSMLKYQDSYSKHFSIKK